MRKGLLYIGLMFVLISFVGCTNQTASDNVEQIIPDHNEVTENSLVEQNKVEIIDTEYYTIAIPLEWKDEYVYDVISGEHYNYSLNFYEKKSHEEMNAGYLFGIQLMNENEDYKNYPSYEVLGSLEVYRIGSYNVVVTYPTDVQFMEATAKKYNSMTKQIPEILETIKFKEECTFSETPIEIVSEALPQDKMSEFYAELCEYVVLTCVNYTEWWTEPKISYTDPKHYYLGNITEENYSEKMTKAKELVDGVYKAGYWEIRHRGYGKLKIGLAISENNELYFCYED